MPWGIAGCDVNPDLVWLQCQERKKNSGGRRGRKGRRGRREAMEGQIGFGAADGSREQKVWKKVQKIFSPSSWH